MNSLSSQNEQSFKENFLRKLFKKHIIPFRLISKMFQHFPAILYQMHYRV